MIKLTMSFAALVLYGSLGMASGISHHAPREEPSVPVTLPANVPADARADGSCEDATRMISEEERERRVKVCERAWEDCRDWCTRTKGGASCYEECSKRLGECMKDIPYAGKD
jgi:hypothetical protein